MAAPASSPLPPSAMRTPLDRIAASEDASPRAPVRLFYLLPSHYCEKARAILAYKGIPHVLERVPYGDHEHVIRVSGQDYVPFIEVPGREGVLWPDIADWAERAQAQPTLYPGPDAAATRATSRVIESWAHSVVEEAVWKYVVAEVPAVLEAGRERWVFVEMQERTRGPLEWMAARKDGFRAGVEEVCAIADELLGAKPFLLTDAPSLADFALYGALHPLKLTGNAISQSFPRLEAWHARMSDLAGPLKF